MEKKQRLLSLLILVVAGITLFDDVSLAKMKHAQHALGCIKFTKGYSGGLVVKNQCNFEFVDVRFCISGVGEMGEKGFIPATGPLYDLACGDGLGDLSPNYYKARPVLDVEIFGGARQATALYFEFAACADSYVGEYAHWRQNKNHHGYFECGDGYMFRPGEARIVLGP